MVLNHRRVVERSDFGVQVAGRIVTPIPELRSATESIRRNTVVGHEWIAEGCGHPVGPRTIWIGTRTEVRECMVCLSVGELTCRDGYYGRGEDQVQCTV